MACIAAGTARALALGAPASAMAVGLLALCLLATLVAGGQIVSRALAVTRARVEHQAIAAEARFGAGIARAHDWIRVEAELRALSGRDGLDPYLLGSIVETLSIVDRLRGSMLLFTLIARAILVLLAPLLGAWTRAATPVAETGPVADVVWGAAASVCLATAAIAPRVVDTAMRDNPQATEFRRRLLRIETPIALLTLVGWTNWWQRQTPRLEFDWASCSNVRAGFAAPPP